jgi:hypothetical protein
MQISEFIEDKGWKSFIQEVLYFNRKAILVEKNLSEAVNRIDFLRNQNIQFIEITPETFTRDRYTFYSKNRMFKALHYLKNGYCGHAIAKENTIIGDMWYFALKNNVLHSHKCPDIQWLNFELTEDTVYSFDIYVVPTERGNNLSAALQSTAMYSLFEKGYTKAYAYYWSDNIPAVWNTRVINKWNELRPVTVSRFLWRKKLAMSKLQIKNLSNLLRKGIVDEK